MNFEMQKANMLAENINSFIRFVHKNYQNKPVINKNRDKWYQIKLLIEEYQFQIISDELFRINQYSWDEKYTHLLVDRLKKGMDVLDEYIKNNYEVLYILTARMHTLRSLSESFTKKESL